MYRLTAGEARAILQSRREHDRVETQREALAVWNPFSDKVLDLWLEVLPDLSGEADMSSGCR